MSFLRRLKFWKREEPMEENEEEMMAGDIETSNPNMEIPSWNPRGRENIEEERFEQPRFEQRYSGQNTQEIVLARLEVINAKLDVLNQRLMNMERYMAEQEKRIMKW